MIAFTIPGTGQAICKGPDAFKMPVSVLRSVSKIARGIFKKGGYLRNFPGPFPSFS